MLRHLHLLAGEGEVPVEPVLRIALDAVNSEASFQDAEARKGVHSETMRAAKSRGLKEQDRKLQNLCAKINKWSGHLV